MPAPLWWQLRQYLWAIVQFAVSLCNYRGIALRDVLGRQGFLVQDVVALVGIFTVLIFGIYGPAYDAAAFIYMNF